MGQQDEQGSERDGTGTSDDATVASSAAARPSDAETDTAVVPKMPVRVDDRRREPGASAGLRRAIQTIFNLVALVVRFVGFVLAAVLIVRIALVSVPVNPGNVIVGWIVRFSDVIVWGFRDLFLPSDPRIALMANYGLAAVFWLVLALVVASILSAVGARVGGRGRF